LQFDTYHRTRQASYLGYMTQAIINNLPALLFVTWQREFSFSLQTLGALVSFNFVVQLVTDALAAKYLDGWGYRRSVVLAHVFATIGLLSMAFLPNIFRNPIIGLAIAMLFNGVGGGLTEVLVSPIVEALPSDEKSSAMSLLHSFYSWGFLAVVIGTTLFLTLVGSASWRWVLVVWAIVPFLNSFLFAKVPILPIVSDEEKMGVKELFTQKKFLLFIVLMIAAGASEQAIVQWASYFSEIGLSLTKAQGNLFGPALFALFMALSRTYIGKKGKDDQLVSTLLKQVYSVPHVFC